MTIENEECAIPLLDRLCAGTLNEDELRCLDERTFMVTGRSFAEVCTIPTLMRFPQWEELLQLDLERHMAKHPEPLTEEDMAAVERILARMR